MQKNIFSLFVFILTIQFNWANDLSFDSLNTHYNSKYETYLNSSVDTLVFNDRVQLLKGELQFNDGISEEKVFVLLDYVAQAQAIKLYDVARQLLNSAISLSNPDAILTGFFYFKKGDIWQVQRKDVQALECYLNASLIFEQRSENAGCAYSNFKIAFINFNGLNNTIALRYAEQSILNFKIDHNYNKNDSVHLTILYSLIGIVNRRLGRYDSSLAYIERSLALSKKMGDSLRVASSNGDRAAVFFEKGDLESAEPLLVTDFKTSMANGVYYSAFNAGVLLGNIYLQNKEHKKLDSIFQIVSELKDSNKLFVPNQSLLFYYNLAANKFKNQNNDSLSQFYYRKVAQTQENIDSAKRVNDFDRLQEKYLMEKEITKLELLQKTNELQSSHLKLRTTMLVIIAFALIVVLWYVYVLRHKNRKIDKLNELLEVKVSERTTRLMEINKELDNYLYRASHDIRRPIRTLLGLNNVVKFTDDPLELKLLFEKVYDTAMNMDEMLFKLQMAYELNNTHEIEEVDVYELINNSLLGMERLIDLKNASVKIDKNDKAVQVRANNALLKIAIDNIVENALIYHNQEQPKVNITTDEGKYYFYIHIQDNGYGVDEAYLGKIFESYFKISNKTQGSGLGLFLAQRAVSFLAGEISIDSVINEGSQFTIKIPINPK